MMKHSKLGVVFICCPNCKAPILIPQKIERNIENYRSCECWDCKKDIPFNKDFRYFVRATRAFEEDCY